MSDAQTTTPPGQTMRSGRVDDDYKALGMAAGLFMNEPSFARLRFGHWTSILVGQIRRKHYLFAFEDKRLTGFVGWALTDHAKAEAWITGSELAFEDSKEGDHIVVNAWVAKTSRTHQYLVDQMRQIGKGRQAYYFKRFYKDGRVRPVRLPVGSFVNEHLDRGFTEPAQPRRT